MAKQPKVPMSWVEHPTLVAQQRLAEELCAKRAELAHALVPVRQTLDEAQAAFDEAEIQFWADRGTKETLASAQKALEAAKREHARGALALRDVESDLARAERDLPTVTIRAREQVARALADMAEQLLTRFTASLEAAGNDWRDLQTLTRIATEQYRGDIQDDPGFGRGVGIPVDIDLFYTVFCPNGLLEQFTPAVEYFKAHKQANTTYKAPAPEVWQGPEDVRTSPMPPSPTPALEPWASEALIARLRDLTAGRATE
jgi:hypothetical protein